MSDFEDFDSGFNHDDFEESFDAGEIDIDEFGGGDVELDADEVGIGSQDTNDEEDDDEQEEEDDHDDDEEPMGLAALYAGPIEADEEDAAEDFVPNNDEEEDDANSDEEEDGDEDGTDEPDAKRQRSES